MSTPFTVEEKQALREIAAAYIKAKTPEITTVINSILTVTTDHILSDVEIKHYKDGGKIWC